ncbi:hypothetical protein [Micromonospora sp. NPDC005313]|uniref:hypothetical protein n=1 Tax=unclassified Micromonospora TaxID=2617518 RepID=UPI0033A74C96
MLLLAVAVAGAAVTDPATGPASSVKTHPGFQHVFPSGILAPTSSRYGSERAEYSVKRAFLREFAEELFGYDDLAYDSRDLRDSRR